MSTVSCPPPEPLPKDHLKHQPGAHEHQPGEAQQRRLASAGGAYTSIFDEKSTGGGPLRGVSVAVKDVFDMVGRPTRLGSASEANAEPASRDALVIARLREAGASFVGKTAMHELALGATGVNHFEGTPLNPLDPARVPGGSSSGSAVAVAHGTADVALGSDTGGSSRIPAAFCGVVGFKPRSNPTWMAGVFPLAPTLDQIGILGRDVPVVDLTWRTLADIPASAPFDGARWRFWWDADAMAAADSEIADTLEDRIQRLIPWSISPISFSFSGDIMEVSSAILAHEAFQTHRFRLAEHADQLGSDVRERLQTGQRVPAAEYQLALRARATIRETFDDLIGKNGIVIGPSVICAPPSLTATTSAELAAGRLTRCTRLANLTGGPALALPIGAAASPHLSVQIQGSTDGATLAFAAHLEQALQPR